MSDPQRVQARDLLFDNDGVLVDSTAAVEDSWRAFAGWYDLPVDDVLERVHGRRSRDVIMHYADRLPVSADEAFARYIDACIRDFAQVELLPRNRGSRRLPPRAGMGRRHLRHQGRDPGSLEGCRAGRPTCARQRRGCGGRKPKPDPYRTAAQRLGLDPADCLAIEDSPAGLTSARAAGCKTLALLTTHPREDLDADLLAADLAAVRITKNDGFDVVVSPSSA